MHQPFEDRPHRSPSRAGGDPRYWELYCKGYGLDPDIARERWEKVQRTMFNPYDANLPDEPLFCTHTQHALNFKCQCKQCARLCTITMQDAAFLRTIGIIWRVPPNAAKETTDRGQRGLGSGLVRTQAQADEEVHPDRS